MEAEWFIENKRSSSSEYLNRNELYCQNHVPKCQKSGYIYIYHTLYQNESVLFYSTDTVDLLNPFQVWVEIKEFFIH